MRKLATILAAFVGVLILPMAFATAYGPVNAFFMEGPVSTRVLFGLLTALPLVATCALAAYLIIARERIATRLVPDDDPVLIAGAGDVFRAGLVLLGVFLVVEAIPTLVGLVVSPFAEYLQVKASTIAGQVDFSQFTLAAVLWGKAPAAMSAMVSLGIGALLVARRDRIVRRVFGPPMVRDAEADGPGATCAHCGAGYDPADYDGRSAVPRCVQCHEPLVIPRV